MLHSITDWLGDLPLGSLYVAIAALSAFENFFPPFPFDAVLAFGSFLADSAHGSPLAVFFIGFLRHTAAAVWFGLITFLAFRAGDNLDLVERYLVRSGKVAGGIAIGIVVLVVGIWLWKRSDRKRE